jgi:hypothetical protein
MGLITYEKPGPGKPTSASGGGTLCGTSGTGAGGAALLRPTTAPGAFPVRVPNPAPTLPRQYWYARRFQIERSLTDLKKWQLPLPDLLVGM